MKLSLERIRLLRLEVGFSALNQNRLLEGFRGCPNPFTEIKMKEKNEKSMKGEMEKMFCGSITSVSFTFLLLVKWIIFHVFGNENVNSFLGVIFSARVLIFFPSLRTYRPICTFSIGWCIM